MGHPQLHELYAQAEAERAEHGLSSDWREHRYQELLTAAGWNDSSRRST